MPESVSIGTSTVNSIPFVVEKMRAIRPRSILDVGCGWGRWGFLAREFLELWEHRYRREEWEVPIDAIDIHPGTWTPVHSYVYDSCVTDDIRTVPMFKDWDLIIACDVIEHMTKEDGLAVLERLTQHGRHVLIGIPLGPGWLRGGFDNNAHEAHLSEWSHDDFRKQPVIDHELIQTEDLLDYGLYHLALLR